MRRATRGVLLLALTAAALLAGGMGAVGAPGSALDLATWSASAGPVSLSGPWEFYWSQLLTPADLAGGAAPTGMIQVPGAWNGYPLGQTRLSGEGYATYRLQVRLPPTDVKAPDLALYVPYMSTAYHLWLNGSLAASIGTVGTTRDTTVPRYENRVIPVPRNAGELDLVVQVANFHHRRGGMVSSIQLGGAEQVARRVNWQYIREIALFGCLLLAAIYHFAFFAVRRLDRAYLYLGLFALLIAGRLLVTGEMPLLLVFPRLAWETQLTLEYLTFFLGLPAFIAFLRALYPAETPTWMAQATFGLGAAFSLVTLLFPARITSQLVPAYQVLTALAVLYVLYLMVTAVQRRRPDAALLLGSALFGLAAVLVDILYANRLIAFGELTPVGLFVFMSVESLVVARRFDSLHQLLIRDGLTGLFNDRHFFERLNREMARARSSGWRFCVALIGIEGIQFYNDVHGRQAGNRVLALLAQALCDSLRPEDLAFRLGGAELAVIFPGADRRIAILAYQRFRRALEQQQLPAELSLPEHQLSASVGIAEYRAGGDTADRLLQRADNALFRARRTRGSTVT